MSDTTMSLSIKNLDQVAALDVLFY